MTASAAGAQLPGLGQVPLLDAVNGGTPDALKILSQVSGTDGKNYSITNNVPTSFLAPVLSVVQGGSSGNLQLGSLAGLAGGSASPGLLGIVPQGLGSGASKIGIGPKLPLKAPPIFTFVNPIVDGITNPLAAGLTQNHVVNTGGPAPREYLVVWAGDWNVADNSANDLLKYAQQIGVNVVKTENDLIDDLPGPDFFAVIDADPASATYGKVVNTVTVPLLPAENEPHHMQYIWHRGDKIFAGGLFGDTAFILDTAKLPLLDLVGVVLPTDTPCGSVPDAFWTLSDGSALGTWMGGADAGGACVYSNGDVHLSNGFAGTPGSLVRIGKPAGEKYYRVLAELPAATSLPQDTDPVRCPTTPNIPTTTTLGSPLPSASLFNSCANPHGIQFREDLNAGITTDYAEPRNVPINPIDPIDEHLFRDTVRIWTLDPKKPLGAGYKGCGKDLDCSTPKVLDVKVMPDGPRHERNPGHEEPRGIMEGTVTYPVGGTKGAFAESMCGGAIFYTPDFTDPNIEWREVFDDTAAAKTLNPNITEGAGCSGGGWVQTSPDNKLLYHAVIGRGLGSLGQDDPGTPKYVYTLNIQKLIAAGNGVTCKIDSIDEVANGGAEPDCPTLAGIHEIADTTSGGPHWGSFDNFDLLPNGKVKETNDIKRFAVSDYFVARSGVDGNHKVYIVNVDKNGKLTRDTKFVDENEGTPGIDFNRTAWPHGLWGKAKPHSMLFVAADSAFE